MLALKAVRLLGRDACPSNSLRPALRSAPWQKGRRRRWMIARDWHVLDRWIITGRKDP
jgi:hypothetical protein